MLRDNSANRKKVIEKLKQFTAIILKDLPVSIVIFFGAWLEGTATEDDEIDIAVVVDSLKTDYIEAIGILKDAASTVDPRIEATLIESSRKDHAGFLKEILENGVVIYRK